VTNVVEGTIMKAQRSDAVIIMRQVQSAVLVSLAGIGGANPLAVAPVALQWDTHLGREIDGKSGPFPSISEYGVVNLIVSSSSGQQPQ
jgi:hypothetical protein